MLQPVHIVVDPAGFDKLMTETLSRNEDKMTERSKVEVTMPDSRFDLVGVKLGFDPGKPTPLASRLFMKIYAENGHLLGELQFKRKESPLPNISPELTDVARKGAS
jgi:hypothetical protein